MNIDDYLYNDIVKYCELNNKDLNTEINNMLKIGFSIVKYGNSPFQKMKEQMKNESFKPSEQENVLEEPEKNEETVTQIVDKPKKTIRIIKNK